MELQGGIEGERVLVLFFLLLLLRGRLGRPASERTSSSSSATWCP